ncbi:MAG: aspartyl protease family protein [Chitinophagales bacterium]|nr:aspartyl protease family protein [Bacteroidota bacterium]
MLVGIHANASPTYDIQQKKGKTSIPFKLYNNIIIADLEINGKTLQFIFDSGCKSTIILHPMWLDSFQIESRKKLYFVGLGVKDSVEMIKLNNATLKLGALFGQNIPVFILSKDSINLEKYLGINVDGIFGAELFEKYYVHLNFKKRQIELFEKKPKKKIKSAYTKLPITIRNSKGYTSCVLMNDNNEVYTSELLFDTGANISLIIKNVSPEDLHIHKYIDAEIGEGLAGAMYSKISRVHQLFVDTFKFKNVIAAYSDVYSINNKHDEYDLDGNIGNDILFRFDAYFAYPENAIYLHPNKHYNDIFDLNISNIILLENKTKNYGFVVKSVTESSAPSIAGLQKGDEIIKIDNHKSSTIDLEDALYLLNRKIGKKINIQFLRNDVLYKINYKINRII